MTHITKIKSYALSSKYGDGKVLGQPKSKKTLVFVEIKTDSKLSGIGETYCGVYFPELIDDIVKSYSLGLKGVDIFDYDQIKIKKEVPFVGRDGLLSSIWSAIDIALWDIRSKCKNKPISELISNSKISFQNLYASGGSAALSPHEITKDVKLQLDNGFKSYKMRIGYQKKSVDLKRVEFAKKMLGEKNILMLDAIMGTLKPPWDLQTARQYIEDLRKYEPFWLEEPLHPSNIEDHIRLRKTSKINIASGEALSGYIDYWSFIKNKAVDIIQLDVTHCGGITGAIEIIKLAEKHNLKIALHVWGSKLSFLSNLHVSFLSKNIIYLEFPTVNLDLSNYLDSEELFISESTIFKPTFSGVGIRFKSSLVNKFKFIKGSGFKL